MSRFPALFSPNEIACALFLNMCTAWPGGTSSGSLEFWLENKPSGSQQVVGSTGYFPCPGPSSPSALGGNSTS